MVGITYYGPQLFNLIYDNPGRASQIAMIFGKDGFKPSDASQSLFILDPLPEYNITQNYAKTIQSALKMLVDGSQGWVYVPGRTSKTALVYTSSKPHLVLSTILFIILVAFLGVCHFRAPIPQFTFVSLAASLAHSDTPRQLDEARVDSEGLLAEQELLDLLGDKYLELEGDFSVTPTTIHIR